MLYVVMPEGVQTKPPCGVFTEKAEARKAARKWLSDQPDDYHEVVVHQYPLNVCVPMDAGSGCAQEQPVLYRYRRTTENRIQLVKGK